MKCQTQSRVGPAKCGHTIDLGRRLVGPRCACPTLLLMLALLLGGVAQALAEPPAAVLDAEARRIAVINQAKDTVLAIFPASGQGGGSGVVISPDGFAITNYHVVLPCGHYMQCGMADRKAYDAVLVGIDPTGDIALIKLFGRDDFPYAELADSDKVRAGDWVFAVGNPFLLATDFQPTVTYGIISGVASLPVTGRDAAGIYRLPPDRRLDQPGQLGRAAVRPPRPRARHQRPRLLREARAGQRRRRLRRLDQPDQELPGHLHSGRIVDHATLGATMKLRRGRPRGGRSNPRRLGRLSPRAARRRRARQLRRTAHRHGQRLQERAGDLSQGLARSAELSPRRQAARRAGPSGGRPRRGGTAAIDRRQAETRNAARAQAGGQAEKITAPKRPPSPRRDPRPPPSCRSRKSSPSIFGRRPVIPITITTNSNRKGSGTPGTHRRNSATPGGPGSSPDR